MRAQFKADPYGCSGELGRKRRERDPFNVGQPYSRTNPELAPLLAHCGPELFDGNLPWPKEKKRVGDVPGDVPRGGERASKTGKRNGDAEKGEESANAETSNHAHDDV